MHSQRDRNLHQKHSHNSTQSTELTKLTEGGLSASQSLRGLSTLTAAMQAMIDDCNFRYRPIAAHCPTMARLASGQAQAPEMM